MGSVAQQAAHKLLAALACVHAASQLCCLFAVAAASIIATARVLAGNYTAGYS